MIKIVFFGTPHIAVNSLEYLINCEDIEVQAVVTQQDKVQGRGYKLIAPPVKQCAEKYNIEIFQPSKLKNDTEIIQKLKDLKPDFFVTFAFGQILSQEVLDIPKFATINLHASLLPKYRGANPIQRAIYNGDNKTGITTMLTVLELDAGDICLQENIDITENMNCDELAEIISNKSPKLLYKTITDLFNQKLLPYKQNNDEVSFANKFKKEDGLIDWSKSAQDIHNTVRALYGWPGAYFTKNNKTIKILKTSVRENNANNPLTILDISKQGILISTNKNSLLIEKVKPEGKGEMLAYDWANGARLKVGDNFIGKDN